MEYLSQRRPGPASHHAGADTVAPSERPQDISEAALCPAGCAGCCAGRLGVSWRRAGAALVSGPVREAHQERDGAEPRVSGLASFEKKHRSV